MAIACTAGQGQTCATEKEGAIEAGGCERQVPPPRCPLCRSRGSRRTECLLAAAACRRGLRLATDSADTMQATQRDHQHYCRTLQRLKRHMPHRTLANRSLVPLLARVYSLCWWRAYKNREVAERNRSTELV